VTRRELIAEFSASMQLDGSDGLSVASLARTFSRWIQASPGVHDLRYLLVDRHPRQQVINSLFDRNAGVNGTSDDFPNRNYFMVTLPQSFFEGQNGVPQRTPDRLM
jgi:hypothetical protein